MLKNPLLDISNLSSLVNQGTNVGGILDKIRLIPVEYIDSIGDIGGNGKMNTGCMILNKVFWIDLEFTKNSGQYQEALTKSEPGDFWTQELHFDLAKNNAEKSSWLYNNIEVGFVAFILDKNRECYLLGNKDTPLFIMSDSFESSIRAGQNKRKFVFSANVEHPAFSLSQAYTELQTEVFGAETWLTFPHKVFSNEFNNQFQ